jgi:hypothetical protein
VVCFSGWAVLFVTTFGFDELPVWATRSVAGQARRTTAAKRTVASFFDIVYLPFFKTCASYSIGDPPSADDSSKNWASLSEIERNNDRAGSHGATVHFSQINYR